MITIEDPVEYRLAGINQIQVNPRAGLTFATALRSILRADPDVVLLGEIRDRETAVIGIEAALTGHLVLSTLHTNSAASTPMRLVEMGVEPFLVTSALDCVLAQRLARRLCDRCKEAYQPTESELVEAGWQVEDLGANEWPTLFRHIGCSSCGRTGYRGRFAIHEVMLITEDIERMIIERRSTDDIQKTAVMQGMLTLREDGLRKVGVGQTSLEEVFRVVALRRFGCRTRPRPLRLQGSAPLPIHAGGRPRRDAGAGQSAEGLGRVPGGPARAVARRPPGGHRRGPPDG